MTLLAAGQHVVRVPTRLMAGARRAGRDRGKSDPIDAETLALAALRHPDLPVASLNGASREVKALSYFRRDLMRQRTQVCNKNSLVPSRGFAGCVVDRIAIELDCFDGVGARPAREPMARCTDLNRQNTSRASELQTLVRQLARATWPCPAAVVNVASALHLQPVGRIERQIEAPMDSCSRSAPAACT